MASSIIRNAMLASVLALLAACGARSPDLPIPTFSVGAITVTCVPTTLAAGQTAQCTATASCTTTNIDANGVSHINQNAQCPAPTWSANPTTIGTIVTNPDGSSTLTGVSPGTVTVIAGIGGATGNTPVTVTAACANSIAITAVPPNASVPAGQSQRYVATATYSNGTTGDVSAQTSWSLTPHDANSTTSDSGVATIDSSGDANSGVVTTNSAVATPTTITINASYSTNVCTMGTGGQPPPASPLAGTATLSIVPATLLPNATGLCIEPVTLANTFTGCRADTGACVNPATQPISLVTGGTQQFVLRARYNNGQECSVTNDPATTWASDTPATMTVSTVPAGGLATGVAPGNANVTASFAQPNSTPNPYPAAPYPVTVTANQVLGKNSLGVSNKDFPTATNPTPTKFACVGATNAAAGLQDPTKIQGQLNLIAKAMFCGSNTLDANGNCPIADSTKPYNGFTNDVTNDDGATAANPTSDRIFWTESQQSSAYWDGAKCVPSGGSFPSAVVGDKQTSAANYPANRMPGENGVVVATSSVTAGFTCVTATYTNPSLATNNATDGMTVLTLPVTSDVLLGANPNDPTQSPERLCDTLAPVFQLAASNPDGSGAITQLLSQVTGVVNPVLQSIDNGSAGTSPVTTITNQLITALNPVTNPLLTALAPVITPVNGQVYQPLLCGLGTLLTAITTANPAAAALAQGCLPQLP
ncbi:MAG: hypothetical protein ACRESS_02290 [Stenotrophobium sp.]